MVASPQRALHNNHPLHDASFLAQDFDVLAVGVSGETPVNLRILSLQVPGWENASLSLERGTLLARAISCLSFQPALITERSFILSLIDPNRVLLVPEGTSDHWHDEMLDLVAMA